MQVSRKSYKAMLNVGICVWSHWFLGFKDQVQQGASTGSCILLIANHSSPEQAIPPLTWAPRSAVLPFPAAAWSGGWDSRETWPKRATFALGPWTKTQQQPYWKFLQEQLYVGGFSTVETSSRVTNFPVQPVHSFTQDLQYWWCHPETWPEALSRAKASCVSPANTWPSRGPPQLSK